VTSSTILGTLKDIQPNKPKPTLELSFSRADASRLPAGRKAYIVLEIGQTLWNGTICNEGARRPYVHTNLVDGLGTKSSCTEVFTKLGLAHDGEVEFRISGAGALGFVRIVQKGTWPPGRERDRRVNASGAGERSPSTQRSATAPQEDESLTAGAPFPFDDPAEITRLANAYWGLISARDVAEERAFEHDVAVARAAGYLTKSLFVRLARWKSVRNTPDYESNTEAEVRAATDSAFRASTDAAALSAMVRLRGVALRTASAILHWMRPERYPILDFRVIAALGEPEPRSYEDSHLYTSVADRIRHVAEQHSLDLRTVDRALWSWDKLRSRRN